jgi:hypothetical protein
MKVSILAILALILASGCVMSAIQSTPTVSTPPSSTPTPAATAAALTATQSPTEAADPDTAIVIQPVVNIHETPGGIVRTDVWLTAGQEVEILGYDKSGDWARIAEGWVWGGCLEGVSDRECRADE